MIISKSDCNKYINELDIYLNNNRDKCVLEYKKLRDNGSDALKSLHSVICNKNIEFTQCNTRKFNNFDEFMTIWCSSLKKQEEEYKAPSILGLMMKNPILQEYSLKLLEKNFYKHYDARTRFKPTEKQEIIYFGKNIKYALFITPTLKESCIVNDRSKIRYTKFKYWTIGHVMTTGIYNCNTNSMIRFNTYSDLINFFILLSKDAHYKYELPIFNLYIKYLRNKYCDCINDTNVNFISNTEPILIPELRFDGNKVKHRYRLDFTIFNANTNRHYGFELSPTSSHMGTYNAPPNNVNSQIKSNWNKEMNKRNEYIYDFDITTITFSDTHLKDIHSCFNIILEYLSKSSNTYNYKDILSAL